MWNLFKRSRSVPKSTPPMVWISRSILDQTTEILRRSGSQTQSHEGVVYWAGRRSGNEYLITTCIAPEAQTTRGSFRTTSATNARVVMYLAKSNLELLGQVHSHPGTFIDHSEGDDEDALMPYEGFYSVIVPNYASQGMHPLTRCGVHIFENNRFRRMTNNEVSKHFHIADRGTDVRV